MSQTLCTPGRRSPRCKEPIGRTFRQPRPALTISLVAHGHDVDRFNRWASDYDQHWMQQVVFAPVQQTVLKLAAEQVPKPGAILDV